MRVELRRPLIAGAVLAALAAIPATALFGFTVDDALVSARYAAHIAAGLGYRFNAHGAVTDGVTPLGFPYLLAPFAHAGPLAALAAAKWIGIVAWLAGASSIGAAIERAGERRVRFAAFALVVASAPLAAWSVAGMETGLALGLASGAVAAKSLGAPRIGAVLAGLASALRPELLPWSLTIAAAPPASSAPSSSILSRGLATALAAAPFIVVVAFRVAIFGRPIPLSVLAKPADLAQGATYALACFLLTGPIALVAPLAWRKLAPWPRWLVAATLVHFVAIALAGGDWMPLSRLAVAALPGAALAAAYIAEVADFRATGARFALALSGEIFAFVQRGADAAHVERDRRALIEELRPVLAVSGTVAAVDIGWLGAATDATIVDLAGLTDPAIAVLPGSHTSKAIPVQLLDTRRVDTLVLRVMDNKPVLTPWTETWFAYAVEDRIAEMPGLADDFEIVTTSKAPQLTYIVARRKTK